MPVIPGLSRKGENAVWWIESDGHRMGRGRTAKHDVSPSLNSDKITESKEVKRWLDGYLGVGEWVMDQSIAVLGSSGYFERKR